MKKLITFSGPDSGRGTWTCVPKRALSISPFRPVLPKSRHHLAAQARNLRVVLTSPCPLMLAPLCNSPQQVQWMTLPMKCTSSPPIFLHLCYCRPYPSHRGFWPSLLQWPPNRSSLFHSCTIISSTKVQWSLKNINPISGLKPFKDFLPLLESNSYMR